MGAEKNSTSFRIPLEIIITIVAFLTAVFIFGVLAHEVVGEKEDWFDTEVFNFLRPRSTPFMLRIFKSITFFGSSLFLLPGYIIMIVVMVYKKRKDIALDIGVIAIVSTLMMWALKTWYARSRPPFPVFKGLTDFSFPSGHATSAFVWCGVLIWLAWSSNWKIKWKVTIAVLLTLFAIAIGISRIVLRYHYASDVLAGFCLGFSFVLLFFVGRKYLRADPKNS